MEPFVSAIDELREKWKEVLNTEDIDKVLRTVDDGFHLDDVKQLRELALIALRYRYLVIVEAHDWELGRTDTPWSSESDPPSPWSSKYEFLDTLLGQIAHVETFACEIGLMTREEQRKLRQEITTARPDVFAGYGPQRRKPRPVEDEGNESEK